MKTQKTIAYNGSECDQHIQTSCLKMQLQFSEHFLNQVLVVSFNGLGYPAKEFRMKGMVYLCFDMVFTS